MPKGASVFKDSKRGNQKSGRDRDKSAEGTIIEYIPNKKISYTLTNSHEPDFPTTVVTWELEKIDNDKTNLQLLHTGLRLLAFISGASMNPRSLAPAILSGVLVNIWLYWSATFIGTSVVAFIIKGKFVKNSN
jgi:hypothetical protein